MKKLEIVVRPEKVAVLKAIFNECGAKGAMFLKISGYGNQKGKEYSYNGMRYFESMFSKVKAETIVSDEVADKIIKQTLQSIPTGESGDGKIFVYDVANVYRIRTGEDGEVAL